MGRYWKLRDWLMSWQKVVLPVPGVPVTMMLGIFLGVYFYSYIVEVINVLSICILFLGCWGRAMAVLCFLLWFWILIVLWLANHRCLMLNSKVLKSFIFLLSWTPWRLESFSYFRSFVFRDRVVDRFYLWFRVCWSWNACRCCFVLVLFSCSRGFISRLCSFPAGVDRRGVFFLWVIVRRWSCFVPVRLSFRWGFAFGPDALWVILWVALVLCWVWGSLLVFPRGGDWVYRFPRLFLFRGGCWCWGSIHRPVVLIP